MMIILNFICCFFLHAQEASPLEHTQSDGLQKSLQREYIYLVSQKEALAQQKKTQEIRFREKIQNLKAQTQQQQKEVVRIAAMNDERHEYLMNLEKRKKELQRKDSSLENIFKKSHNTLVTFESSLRFEKEPTKSTPDTPEQLDFASFDKTLGKSLELLQAATKVETYAGSFLDTEGQLVEGTITRWGRSAAMGSLNDKNYILGPNGEGMLKALEPAPEAAQDSMHLYIFESLNKVAKIQRQAGWTEKLADLSPLLFLAMILLLVAGLFSALIKV